MRQFTFQLLTLKHMKAFARLGLFAVLLCVGGFSTAVSQVKMGFVDTDVIIQQMPEFKDIENRLKVLQESYVDTLRAMEANYKAKVETYQRQQAMLNAEAKAVEENQIKAIGEQYLQFQQDRLGPQGKLAQYQSQLLDPIKVKVKNAIEKVSKDEKLTAVMDKAMLIYFDAKLDITFKVLDYLRRGNN